MTVTTSTLVASTYYPTEADGLKFRVLGTTQGHTLPDGFPNSLDSPLAWTKSQMQAQENDWLIHLSFEELKSIDDALRGFQASSLEPAEISQITFPLSNSLAKRLDSVSEECYSGRGFCIIRGIDPTKYTDEENALLYTGISAYVAPIHGFQDITKSHVLCHVTNRVSLKNAAQAKETPAFTDGPMVFHTDLGDILSLYSVNVDPAGAGLLASSWQVYNELAATRPDLICTLSEEWVYDDYARNPPDHLPLFAYHDNKLIVHCSRYPLTGFGSWIRNPDLPAVTEKQLEALDAVHFTAQRNAIKLPNQVGDIVYINNKAMLHGRNAMAKRDNEGELSKRHRMKFWLRDPKRAWKLPSSLDGVDDKVFGANRPDGSRVETLLLRPELEGVKTTRWYING
ncbi:hypothetical protein B0J14DRAFT_496316 [Halenospora varia]|nr:hypothetical protein B0J14DRAFT_496316 [Halenospora varia]